METRFTDIHQSSPSIALWSSFYHAGTAWLITYEFLKEHPDEVGFNFMYTDPFIASLALELNVKAMAAFHDRSFNPRHYSHNATKILRDYARTIPLFDQIINNPNLLMLIKEYQKTVDSRYGTIGGMIPGDEQRQIIDTAYKVRGAMSALTGLH